MINKHYYLRAVVEQNRQIRAFERAAGLPRGSALPRVLQEASELAPQYTFNTRADVTRHRQELLALMDGTDVSRAKDRDALAAARKSRGAYSVEIVGAVLKGVAIDRVAANHDLHTNTVRKVFLRTINAMTSITVKGLTDARAQALEILEALDIPVDDPSSIPLTVRRPQRPGARTAPSKGHVYATILCRVQDEKVLKDLAAKWRGRNENPNNPA